MSLVGKTSWHLKLSLYVAEQVSLLSSIGRGISTISGASDKIISDGNTVNKSHTFLGKNVGNALKDVLLCISSWRSGAVFDAG